MVFTSLPFYLFLPLVYLIFCVSAPAFRWVVLLVASYLFYAALRAPLLILALAFTTVASYWAGVRMGRVHGERQRQQALWLGVGSCALTLVGIKAMARWASLTDSGQGALHLATSIGVSYFTFQAIAYLADVYLETQEPERHFGLHALSLAFFPKLMQGPIERAGRLLHQFRLPYAFDYSAMRSGLVLFAWGFFKKVVLADRLAQYADAVFGHVHGYSGLPLLLGTYAYALQIYFDFAGYTDMARGIARLFGIQLMENFNRPYASRSIPEFWRRWHISFSTWILDYLFKPMQMAWRDRGQAGTALALMAAFLISGLWHGVSWGFLAWGGLHGAYLVASLLSRGLRKRVTARFKQQRWLPAWQVFVTFHLVCLAWVFFRAETLRDAFYLLRNLSLAPGDWKGLLLSQGKWEFLMLVIGGAGFLALDWLRPAEATYFRRPLAVRWFGYAALMAGCRFLAVSSGSFIYFGF